MNEREEDSFMLVINSNFIYNENVLNSLPDICMTIKTIGCISRGKIEIYIIAGGDTYL